MRCFCGGLYAAVRRVLVMLLYVSGNSQRKLILGGLVAGYKLETSFMLLRCGEQFGTPSGAAKVDVTFRHT